MPSAPYPSASAPLAVVQRGESLHVLVYDSAGESTKVILYKTLHQNNISFHVGSLDGRAGKVYRGYPDRVPWLIKTLQSIDSTGKDKTVVHVDARDTICLCNAEEILSKQVALTGAERVVVIGAEALLWPDEGEKYSAYRSVSLEKAYSDTPSAEFSTPLMYINTGFLAGKSRTLLDLFSCMKQRFVSFPDACPRRILSDGTVVSEYSERLRYNFSKNSWHGPLKFGPGPGWGYDQACFHAYYLDQRRGYLPSSCPRLVLDTRAELVLSVGQQVRAMRWHNRPGRIQYNRTGAWPCFIHTNGPFKHVLNSLKRWWHKSAPPHSFTATSHENRISMLPY
jgi:hypothetical protein